MKLNALQGSAWLVANLKWLARNLAETSSCMKRHVMHLSCPIAEELYLSICLRVFSSLAFDSHLPLFPSRTRHMYFAFVS